MPAVSLRDVLLTYPNGATALAGVTLDVPAGDAVTVIGPSGAGKTSLLRVIAGLEPPDRGAVLFDGRDVTRLPPWRRGVALVPQRPSLFPHLSVAGNLAIGLTIQRSWPARLGRWLRRSSVDLPSHAEIDRRVADAADLLRLKPLLNRRPHELSGGEQQRVVLGRAVVRGAKVWLLDEPLAALDVPFRTDFHRELPLLRERLLITMVHVTHDPVEVLALGRLLAVLDRGRLCQLGTVAEVAGRPRHRFAAQLLGRPPRNWLEGRLAVTPRGPTLVGVDDLTVPVPAPVAAGLPDGHPLAAAFGTEAVSVGPAESGALDLGRWRLLTTEPVGPLSLATVGRGGLTWRVWWPSNGTGADVPLAADPRRAIWFDGVNGLAVGTYN